MNTSISPCRAVGFTLAAVCALLLGSAQSAGAATKLRGVREFSGLWAQFPHSLNFDPGIKRGEAQKVVLQPEYDARYKDRLVALAKGEAEGKPLANSSTLCLPNGMPGSMWAFFPIEIVVKEKTAYVFAEGTDTPRRIFLDGRPLPPLEDLEPTFAGYSVGRWEGDTLVVDTAAVKTTALLQDVPHSNAMRINERIRLLDDDTMEIVFTLTDPEAFSAPWVITKQYKDYNVMALRGNPNADTGAHPDHKGFELVTAELVCNENNRNLTDENGVVGLTIGGR